MSTYQENQARSERQDARRQIPSLDEALQYSPFTSILPFTSDVIPGPEALPSTESPSLLNNNEQAILNKTVEALDTETRTPPGPSPRLVDRVVGDLRDILDPNQISKFNILIPKNATNSGGESSKNEGRDGKTARHRSGLGPFARTVLNATDVTWQKSTTSLAMEESNVSPSTNNSTDKKNKGSNHVFSQGSGAPVSDGSRPVISTQEPLAQGTEADAMFMQHPVVVIPAVDASKYPTQQTSQKAPEYSTPLASSNSYANDTHGLPEQPRDSLVVMLPEFPPSSNPSDYQFRPDLDEEILRNQNRSSKKRKRDEDDHKSAFLAGQKEEADEAVQSFQEMLMDMFQAEDQLELGRFDLNPSETHKYFVIGRDESGHTVTLGAAVLTTLENSLTRLIRLKRFADLPVEQLVRLEKIALSTVSSASEISLEVPTDEDDETIEQWTRRVETAENGLRASRLLLRIMVAGESNKQLASEELVKEVVNNLKHVLESAVLSLAEKRKSSEEGKLFERRPDFRTLIVSLMQRSARVLKLTGDLVLLGELSETSVTTTEFLATKIIFTENAPSEKESILGFQRFEVLRRNAMDVVAKVFFRHPEQREFLLNEVLSSLEKLPVTRQSARQYKIADGKPIQLVSALIMQLVQTSTMWNISSKTTKGSDRANGDEQNENSDSESSSETSSRESSPETDARRSRPNGVSRNNVGGPIENLKETCSVVSKAAESNASIVCSYLVQRALNTTKTGDQPYRNLLDIFTEDFLNVLGFPEWPAAEMLLRALLARFFRITNDDKSSAPGKNMALEMLGTIGSGIAELRAYVSRSIEGIESEVNSILRDVAQIHADSLSSGSPPHTMLRKEGPYRVVVDYLQNSDSNSIQLQSARCFVLAQWARNITDTLIRASESGDDQDDPVKGGDQVFSETAPWLTSAIRRQQRNTEERQFNDVQPRECRFFYALILLNMPLCRAYDRLFGVLLRALSSQQATVRSRGIKSVSQLLEKDASILGRAQHVMAHIVHATTDASPLVRDSALTLVGKCVGTRPEFESDASKALVNMSYDPAAGVRKRSLRLLRDLYLQSKTKDIRAAIADAVLRRLNDIEESIVELARQTLEDIWFSPFYGSFAQAVSPSIQSKRDLEDLTSLIMAIVGRGDGVSSVLESFFKYAVNESAKNTAANRKVCTAVVTLLFESVIDNDQEEGKRSRRASLQTLTIFAKSDPHLFDGNQMLTLKPYIENITFSSDEILLYRSIIIIYRRVLPVLPPLQKGFLLEVQDILLKNITKLGKQELNETTACLWIINDVLQNSERLARVIISVLLKIEGAKKGSLKESKEIETMKRLIRLAGYFGKACDFQAQREMFKEKFPSWKGKAVSELLVGILIPLANRNSPLAIRESALDSICLVAQSYPQNFLKAEVSTAFRTAFEDQEKKLVLAVLSGFRSFYLLEDERSKPEEDVKEEEPAANGANKLGKSMNVSHNDGASTSIAQQFLQDVLRIALSYQGDLATVATDIITSTNRQGLVHPRECGPALVALETSPDPYIAKAALEEHRSLHSKHESMLDKEYLKAVEQAFSYQRDTIGSVSGVDTGMVPKLRSFYEVLKIGSVALRKKLLANLCARVNFDVDKTAEKDIESRLLFSRFVLENLSLFEYGRVDELLHLISCIEKIFTSYGNAISQRIEASLGVKAANADVPQQDMQVDNTEDEILSNGNVDHHELQKLTVAAMVLSMLWQTRSFLRRAWGLQSLRSGKAKQAAKDASKAPVRVPSVAGEEHMEQIAQIADSLKSEATMLGRCRAFVDLLAVDTELKIEDEQDEAAGDDGGGLRNTPSEDGVADGIAGEGGPMMPPSGGAKRSRKVTPSSAASTPRGTPSKRGRPSLGGGGRRASKLSLGEDGEMGWD